MRNLEAIFIYHWVLWIASPYWPLILAGSQMIQAKGLYNVFINFLQNRYKYQNRGYSVLSFILISNP